MIVTYTVFIKSNCFCDTWGAFECDMYFFNDVIVSSDNPSSQITGVQICILVACLVLKLSDSTFCDFHRLRNCLSRHWVGLHVLSSS